jgi:hypothetical protein
VIAKRFLLPFLLLLLTIGGASAQLAGEKVRQPWLMLSKLTSPISVTTSSAATQLPSMGLELWACNMGTFDAYLGFGTANTVSVTVATGSWLRAGGCAAYDLYPPGLAAPYTYVAAIGSGGSTTIYLEAGIGQPPLETSVVATGTIGATQGTSPWVITSVPTSASGNALSHCSVSSLSTSLVCKTLAGNLYAFNCTAITGGAAGFCVAYNATAAPSTGALTGTLVLDVCPFNSNTAGCSLSRIPMGVNYSAGIVILVTTATTPFTYTTGTDTAFISADYE